jgi:protein phosphatase
MGKVREDNQDAIRLCKPDDPLNETSGFLYGIADGMGGYSHGGIASALALSTFFETVYSSGNKPLPQTMKRGVQDANLRVYQEAMRLGVRRMGTTITAISILGDQMHIAHVGDSRAFLIRDGKSTCVTNDHTMVGDLVRMKVLTPDKVRNHAQRSVLNKSLGIEMFVQPDVTQVTLKHGDIIILCTDGVWALIEDDEFAHITKQASDLDNLNQRLVDLALERDSDDNVSVMSIHAEKLASVANKAPARRGFGISPMLWGRSVNKS